MRTRGLAAAQSAALKSEEHTHLGVTSRNLKNEKLCVFLTPLVAHTCVTLL